MLKFFTEDDFFAGMDASILYRRTHTTPRNGNSISLRPIVYNCIREVYFEIFDYPRDTDNIDYDFQRKYFFAAPVGSLVHEYLQKFLGIDNMPYTEKLYSFKNALRPLIVRTRCDGIDTRDENNKVLYEFKTKDKAISTPPEEELLQALLSVYLFNNELGLDIKGLSMVYIDRKDATSIRFFNYDLYNKDAPNYMDPVARTTTLFNKIRELLVSVKNKRAPSIHSLHVKKFEFKRKRCDSCPYRRACNKDVIMSI